MYDMHCSNYTLQRQEFMWNLAEREDFEPVSDLRLVENALAFPTAPVCCICDCEGDHACIGNLHKSSFKNDSTTRPLPSIYISKVVAPVL